ncbi:hypothetical protein A5647_08075 [Mycobacterium sp. 1100029.7]|nr:hypothetical protein A5647_08075 [Mycobacterium sp. 1100029.7]
MVEQHDGVGRVDATFLGVVARVAGGQIYRAVADHRGCVLGQLDDLLLRRGGAGDLTDLLRSLSATEASPQVSSVDCCTQYWAAASGSPYTALPVAAVGAADEAGGVVAARTEDRVSHADTSETLAVAMTVQTSAVRIAVAVAELNMMPPRPGRRWVRRQPNTLSKRLPG